jgi:hypothetical protein
MDHRNGQQSSEPPQTLSLPILVLRILVNVGNVHRLTLDYCTPDTGPAGGADGMGPVELNDFRWCPNVDNMSIYVTVSHIDEALIGSTQPHPIVEDGLEGGVKVGRGVNDGSHDFGHTRPFGYDAFFDVAHASGEVRITAARLGVDAWDA